MIKFKKLLKYVSLSILGVIFFIFVALSTVAAFTYFYPEKTWATIQKFLLPEDLKVSWSNFHIDWNRTKYLDGEITLSIQDLLVKKQKPQINIPVQTLKLNISFHFTEDRNPVRLHKLEIKSKDAFFKAEPDEEPTPELNPFQQLQKYLSYSDYLKKEIGRAHV